MMNQDADARMKEREEELLKEQMELAYGHGMSLDSMALGLTLEQARKVQLAGAQRRLDMVV
jgi:ribosomal protein L13E